MSVKFIKINELGKQFKVYAMLLNGHGVWVLRYAGR